MERIEKLRWWANLDIWKGLVALGASIGELCLLIFIITNGHNMRCFLNLGFLGILRWPVTIQGHHIWANLGNLLKPLCNGVPWQVLWVMVFGLLMAQELFSRWEDLHRDASPARVDDLLTAFHFVEPTFKSSFETSQSLGHHNSLYNLFIFIESDLTFHFWDTFTHEPSKENWSETGNRKWLDFFAHSLAIYGINFLSFYTASLGRLEPIRSHDQDHINKVNDLNQGFIFRRQIQKKLNTSKTEQRSEN